MKLLFLLGMYHPRYSANGLCCKNVIDRCVAEGWQVHCVVNAANGNTEPYSLDGATIHPIRPRLFARITEWCEAHPTSPIRPLLKKAALVLNKTTLLLRSSKWPYVSPSYSRRFFKKAEALHKKEDFDAVVAVFTPMESLYAGYNLKKKYPNIQFIPYYLDALAGGMGPSFWSPEKCNKRQRIWEARINACADTVISMESSRAYHQNDPLPQNEKRVFLDVPMMLPPVFQDAQKKPSQKRIVLYAGSISYPQRNPIPLLEAFLYCCKEADAELWFAGPCNAPEIFTPYIEKTGGRIVLLGSKTHQEVLELEKNADFLLNIGNTNPHMIPCKIFEYMRFGKPIVSTYAIDNESSLERLKKYGAAFFLDERQDAEKNGKALAAFLGRNEQITVAHDLCSALFFENTPEAFTKALKEALSSRKDAL